MRVVSTKGASANRNETLSCVTARPTRSVRHLSYSNLAPLFENCYRLRHHASLYRFAYICMYSTYIDLDPTTGNFSNGAAIIGHLVAYLAAVLLGSSHRTLTEHSLLSDCGIQRLHGPQTRSYCTGEEIDRNSMGRPLTWRIGGLLFDDKVHSPS